MAKLSFGIPYNPIFGNVTANTGVTFSGGGTITGASGAITLTAAGTNQNVTLTPSGTGYVLSNSSIGIGMSPTGKSIAMTGGASVAITHMESTKTSGAVAAIEFTNKKTSGTQWSLNSTSDSNFNIEKSDCDSSGNITNKRTLVIIGERTNGSNKMPVIANNIADNVFVVQQQAVNGFSAIRFDSSAGVETAAFGYGNASTSGPFTDRAYWESSGTGANPPKDMISVTTVADVRHKRINYSTDHNVYVYKWISGSPFVDLNEPPMVTFYCDTNAVGMAGLFTSYNGLTTAGNGVVSVQGAGRSTAQTAAVSSVATYTVDAADASFTVSANVNVTTSSAEAFTVTCIYTDETNTARTATLNFQLLAGTIGTAIAAANGAVPYEGVPIHIRAKAATSITIATTGTFTGCTYNVEGVITKLQ